MVCNIYNTSIFQGVVPLPLKQSIVSPIPKCTPPTSIQSDLRPVSLTPQLSKIMEGFILKPLLHEISSKIDCFQFAMKGRSTTQALVYFLHNVLEALNRGNCSVRAFFADFSKGFDLVDHNILCAEMNKLNIHPALVRWIRSFLTHRSQCVRINNTTSKFKPINGGIPQGTKLGPILFAILVNTLAKNWHLRIKFVDDLSIFEVIPRCSPSLMPFIVNDIVHYANARGMRLNPSKCKEMLFDFLHYRLPIQSPLSIGAQVVESVESLKLLGVHFSRNLTWSVHCDKIIKKANKRLCIINQLRKAGYSTKELVSVYCTLIRPILENAATVWSALSSCLAAEIEMVQKRAMRAIFWPIKLCYNASLEAVNLLALTERRAILSEKFIAKNKHSAGPLNNSLSSMSAPSSYHGYHLRSGSCGSDAFKSKTQRFSNFITCKYRQ